MKQIWHPYTEWECYHAGMFDGEISITSDEARLEYGKFLRDIKRFNAAMARVVKEWPKSCEHFLTNQNINRIAWLGQASMCIETGVPCTHRGGFNTMTNEERNLANAAASVVLKAWIEEHERKNPQVHRNVDGPGLFDGYTG